MDESQLQQIRRFNRLVTQRVGALEANYLRRGRPLAEARLIFEIGADGADVRALRMRLGLDSGYLSRLVRSLTAQGLVAVAQGGGDGRWRRVSLTRKGNAERAAYDRLSDQLAASMLEALDEAERGRLATAVGEGRGGGSDRGRRGRSRGGSSKQRRRAPVPRCVLQRARGALRGRVRR